jgi:hypothetical protein
MERGVSSRSVKTLAAMQRVLAVVSDGPKTCNEVSAILIAEAREAWANRHGYEIEWGSEHEPLGARLLAWGEAEENGCLYLIGHEVYPVLRRLERDGKVGRIQVEGHRPILWVAL